MMALLNEREGRKEAIVDWVRRGGRLIISVGKNHDVVTRLGPIQTALPVTLTGLHQLPQLNSLGAFSSDNRNVEARLRQAVPGARPAAIDVAKMEPKPGRETEPIMEEHEGPPLIVRGSYGMGSVTVVAFDPDQAPFTTYPQDMQAKFWGVLCDKTIPPPKTDQFDARRGVGFNRSESDLAGQLQVNLEEFQEVPVISFGWVALFILVYILIVGPLDYFFLKKVVKRLELTWITFPTVVITISVIAYFTAYWLKGNDQRINKVDLLDIDLETQRVYGNTWFTIFSPRIQHYTVGLEPSGAPPAVLAGKPGYSVNLSWMGRPDTTFGGAGRARSGGLFRRAYDYTPEATAMRGVPIQVWSTKSFESRWEMPFDPAQPLMSADLKHAKGEHKLTGVITSRLPVELRNVALLYKSGTAWRWYDLDRLAPGPNRVDGYLSRPEREMGPWAGDSYGERQVLAGQPGNFPNASAGAMPVVVKQLMFQQKASSGAINNALRYLDQSWRENRKDEVIVFGRLPRQDGPADAIARGPSSLSQLWIGALPGTGEPRQPLLGTMTQEAYVRIVIPVKEAEGP
jgi:hypothetical protein